MKILMLTHTYHPSIGGGIRYKTAVVDHMRARGHQVDVLAVSTNRSMSIVTEPNGAVLRVPTWFEANSSAIAPAYLSTFARLAPGYDALHFNYPSPMTELAMVLHEKRVRQARKIAMYHADIVPAKRFSKPYNRLVTRPFLAAMDHVVVSSPNIVESSPHLARVREKVRVIPFGLDRRAFVLSDPPRKRGREGGELRLLFVGRLSRYKGVDHLIRALRTAPGDLQIVGDGPLREDLVALARRSSLSDRVHFCGRISDEELLREYHKADVLILPSTDAGEAFGYVLIEAMMCGAALVSTELGTGTSFVNEHEKTGLVVPPGDEASLAMAIRSLSENRAFLQRAQDAARDRARSVFEIDRMLSETERLYE